MHYTLFGCGNLGLNLAIRLRETGHAVQAVDKDKQRVKYLKEQGIEAIEADITDPASVNLTETDVAIIISSSDESNRDAVKGLRASYGDLKILTLATDSATRKALLEAGADSCILYSDAVSRRIMNQLSDFEISKKSERLIEIIREGNGGGIAIFLHNSPDPDAMASAMAFKRICEENGTSASVFYGGKIERPENLAFQNFLEFEMEHVKDKNASLPIANDFSKIALLDASSPANNTVVHDSIVPSIIIDHHQSENGVRSADFRDIRPTSAATSAIMTGYLKEMDIAIDERMAAALLYGIRTDTNNYRRSMSSADLETVIYLSALADMELLDAFESPPVSRDTLQIFADAINSMETNGQYMVSCAGFIHSADSLSQVAEFLMQLENIKTVIVYGIYQDNIVISGRNTDIRMNLGKVLHEAFGKEGRGSAGGHATAAAGQIPLGLLGDTEEKDKLLALAASAVKKQFYAAVGITPKKVERTGESAAPANGGNGNGNNEKGNE